MSAQIAAAPALSSAWIGPAPTLSCLPYATGNIDHAVHVGPGAIAITRTLDPLLPTGYDGDDDVRTVELRRTSDLGLIWSRVITSPANALAASADGRLVAVGTYDFTVVLEATTAAEAWRTPGTSFALAFSPTGELAVSHGESVDVHDPGGALQRTVPITGSAPTVIHAMRMDGECDVIYDSTGATANALAFGRDGILLASVSDGSVRALMHDDSTRWMRPQEHSWGYATTAVALEPLTASSMRATYSDGATVTLRTPSMSASAVHPSTCSASETAIARRRLGPSIEGEPIECASASGADTDASGRTLVIAPVTRVHSRTGGSLLAAPTLHTRAGVLVGDEAWLFGVDGTGERWSLGGAGGRFVGPLPIPGHAGAVLDVSEDGRFVAVGTMPMEPHGSETMSGYDVHVVDTRSESVLPGIAFTGARARFVRGTTRIAIEIDHEQQRAIEIRELPGGARVRRVDLAATEYGGLVAVDGRRLIVAEGPHLRIVDVGTGAERAMDLPAGVVEHASLVGDRLAMRVYDQTTPDISDHRIDVIDLSALRVIATTPGASGHDVQLVDAGAAAIYAGADGTVHRLDVASGAVTDVPGLPVSGVVGVRSTAHGMLYAQRGMAGTPLTLAGTATGTTLLDWARAEEHPGATIAYELGGHAYVVGPDGHTRATIESIDGGLVVRTVGSWFSTAPEARGALSVRDGSTLRPCDASMESMHVPGLLEALLAR